jgi:hypothetical protein
LRAEPPLTEATVLVRGGPDTPDKLSRHAHRTARAWSLDGHPPARHLGLRHPRYPARDLLAARFATYRVIHLPAAAALFGRGLELLPTGLRPHHTIRLRQAGSAELSELLAALGPRWPIFSTLRA